MICRRLPVCHLFVLVCCATVCVAQEKPGKPDKKGRDRHAPKIREIGIRDTDTFLEQMKEELKLTASQQSDVKRYVDQYKHESEELKKAVPHSPDSAKVYSDLRDQMQQARTSGDKARQQQLMDQLKAKRQEDDAAEAPIREKLDASQKTLHDQIASLLPEKQKTDFELIWEDAIAGRRRSGGDQNPRMVRAVVMRLPDLTSDQKQTLEEIFKRNEKVSQDAKSAGQRRRGNQDMQQEVMNVLTKDQKEKVTQELAKRSGRGRNAPKKPDSTPGG